MPVKFGLSALFRRRSAKLALAFLAPAVAISLVAFTARAWRDKNGFASRQDDVATQPNPIGGRWRSGLAFQPEADKLRRRLGRRFLAPGREVSVLVGALTLGSERYTAQITRRQDDDDERVMIALNGGPAGAWSGLNGALSGGAVATDSLRSLVERLALDSPDQFILAQLRAQPITPWREWRGRRRQAIRTPTLDHCGTWYELANPQRLLKINRGVYGASTISTRRPV